MREFTSLGTYNEADDTFETVLREEFQLMRKKFEQKVDSLQEETRRTKADKLRETSELKTKIETLEI